MPQLSRSRRGVPYRPSFRFTISPRKRRITMVPHDHIREIIAIVLAAALLGPSVPRALAQQSTGEPDLANAQADDDRLSVLTAAQRRQVDSAVDRALRYLITQQAGNGSFRATVNSQPGVTSLCVMAFLSCGHVPGEGPYGKHLERAVDFVLAVQKKSGFLVYGNVEPYKNYQGSWDHPRQGAHYNHAIAGIMLCEVYGMMDPDHNVKIREAVIPALEITRHYQVSHKRRPHDRGGWRYLFPNANTDSDLSVTSWQLMFMRSAKNAGFDVPAEFVDDAMGYVRRCFHKQDGVFRYSLGDDTRVTRAVNGAGILSLSLGGEHNTEMAHAAGRWLMQQSFLPYNTSGGHVDDYYHYSVYYSTLGMFQLGGEYWRKHFPPIVQILLQHQRTNGSWPPERKVAHIGSAYSTALMVMTLTAPYQLVPIYQR